MHDRSDFQSDSAIEREVVQRVLAEAGAAPTQDALLPILHAIQARIGHLSKETIRQVAHGLNLSRAEVQGVVSFYHDFHEAPHAEHVVQLCMAEACQAVGCRSLAAHAQAELGVAFDQPTPDGRIELQSAYCFGNCATGPSLRIGERVYGRVDPSRFDALIAPLRGDG